jgi:hypothetical protein
MTALRKLFALAPLAATLAFPRAAPAPTGTNWDVVERTPSGFLVRFNDPMGCSGGCMIGVMKLSCPDGTVLGKSERFPVRDDRMFTARDPGEWRFRGHVDTDNHVAGHGSTAEGACGDAPTAFSEPVPRQGRWISCPANNFTNPYPAQVPFAFHGVLPGAALGTRVRIEYTDPSLAGATDTVLVHTDAGGAFADDHAFPAIGATYAASADARFPDEPQVQTVSCEFAVR